LVSNVIAGFAMHADPLAAAALREHEPVADAVLIVLEVQRQLGNVDVR
jgi:hypothetical protein